jgi:hypothetical protein
MPGCLASVIGAVVFINGLYNFRWWEVFLGVLIPVVGWNWQVGIKVSKFLFDKEYGDDDDYPCEDIRQE